MLTMTDEELLAKLVACHSLKQADSLLPPTLASRAECWGLFDGFTGRPQVTSGLVAETRKSTPQARQLASDYDEAYARGAKLAKKKGS